MPDLPLVKSQGLGELEQDPMMTLNKEEMIGVAKFLNFAICDVTNQMKATDEKISKLKAVYSKHRAAQQKALQSELLQSNCVRQWLLAMGDIVDNMLAKADEAARVGPDGNIAQAVADLLGDGELGPENLNPTPAQSIH